MPDTLQTERLLLRPWGPDDVALLASLSSNPRVTRYIGIGHTWTALKAITVAERAMAHWREHGFGWRVAVDLRTGAEVGLISHNLMGDGTAGVSADEHEIGWWVAPEHWGHGVATEGARAVATAARAEEPGSALTARIHPENAASIRVALAIGMRFALNSVTAPGVPVAIYRLGAAAVQAQASAPSG